jgi:hypothetical protein
MTPWRFIWISHFWCALKTIFPCLLRWFFPSDLDYNISYTNPYYLKQRSGRWKMPSKVGNIALIFLLFTLLDFCKKNHWVKNSKRFRACFFKTFHLFHTEKDYSEFKVLEPMTKDNAWRSNCRMELLCYYNLLQREFQCHFHNQNPTPIQKKFFIRP